MALIIAGSTSPTAKPPNPRYMQSPAGWTSLGTVLVISILFVGTSACTVQHRDAVQGKAVQQKINETIVPDLHSYDPTLKIESPNCEPIIIQYPGTMGSCELTVDGVPLKIRVAGAGPPDHFKVDFGGAFFFEMTKVETFVQNTLAQYFKVRAVVGCGDPRPRVRLLQPGTNLTCSVSGAPSVKSIKLKTMPNGNIFAYNPPGLKHTSPIPQTLLTLHKQGETSIARGPDVEAFVSEGMTANPMTHHGAFVIKCRSSVDLTGSKRGICAVSIPGLTTAQRIGVWIEDPVGIRMRPLDAVIDRQRVQALAQADLNRRLRDNSDVADAVVKCEKGLLVIQWPGTFNCKATVGGKRYKLVVLVQDFKGTVSWRGIPEP
jgi:hypothetical protein